MSDTSDLLQIPQDDFLDSFETCRLLCDSAYQAHFKYWKLIDICEEHIRGKKPKDPIKLKESGIHWANNWNYLKARSKVVGIVLENIELIKNSIRLAIPEFKRKSDIKALENDDDRGIISMKVSRVFSEALEKESNFNNWINEIEYPSTAFGYTCVIFDGEDEWMGSPTHPRNIAFEDHTEPDSIKAFVVFRILKADFLWEKWIQARDANIRETFDEDTDISSTNWSVKGLEAVLYSALKDEITKARDQSPGYKNWEEVTNTIANGSRSIQHFIRNTNNVRIAKIFYKELSGKWTETYIPYLNDWQSDSGQQSGDQIIFKKHHGKKHQDRLNVLIRDSSFAEGGYISELRGIAKYTVEDSIRFNRKKNNLEDKLVFSGSPFFEHRNTQQKEAFRITPSQGFTLVSSGFDLIPNQPTFDLNNHLVSIQIDEQHFVRETQHFDAKLEGRLTSRPVKSEVLEKSQEVKRARSSKNSVKLDDYSKLFLNVLRNLADVEVPDQDEKGYHGYTYFYDELEYELRDYIGKEDPKDYIKKLIKSVIAFEIESVLADEQALQLAISMSETAYARNRMKRMLLMVQGFPRKEIDRIAPLAIDSIRNLSDERVAEIENDMFWNTSDVLVDGRDDHIEHLNRHYKKFNLTVQAVQEGRIDVVAAFKYLANLLTHSEVQLSVLGQDVTLQQQYEQLLQIQNEFTKILAQIKSAAQQAIEQRQKEEGQIPPDNLRELQILEFEKVEKQRRTEELTKHKQALTEQKQAHDQALARQQQEFEQQIERLKTESEQRLDLIREAGKIL